MDLIITAHPDSSSLNSKISERLFESVRKQNRQVRKHVLYQETFDPLLTYEEIQRGISWDPLVNRMQQDLTECLRLILVYPDWWGQPPAMLKGWIDRILAPEVAYRWSGGEWEEKKWTPLLTAKEAHIVVTADQKLEEPFVQQLWENSLGKCGMKVCLHLLDNLYKLEYAEIEDQISLLCRDFA